MTLTLILENTLDSLLSRLSPYFGRNRKSIQDRQRMGLLNPAHTGNILICPRASGTQPL
jgi:hypothetical protein